MEIKLGKNKHSFWQALVIALIIFWTGILIGVLFENSRVSEMQTSFSNSAINISDFELSLKLTFNENTSCKNLETESVVFADKIYKESIKLESYDNSNKITNRMLFLHREYDFLRILLWKGIIDTKEKCNNSPHTVIYFYDYLTNDFNKISTQRTMSNYISEIKNKRKNQVILIPIAVDTDLLSSNIMMKRYNITTIPTILIDEKYKIQNLKDLDKINEYIK